MPFAHKRFGGYFNITHCCKSHHKTTAKFSSNPTITIFEIIHKDGWCHSTMAQTTMAHASMTIPLWRRSSLAHPGMARSSTAQVQCGAVSVWRIPVWRRPSTAHFTMAQFRVGASKHRRKRAVPGVTCRLQTKYSNYTNGKIN